MTHHKQADNIETRNVRLYNIEHRAEQRMDGEKEKRVIGGLAAVYNQYTDMGWYLEIVVPGFFSEIDTSGTAALKNHDPNLVLGRTANGTLTMKDTPSGLDYEAIVPDTQTGRDTYEEVKGGYIYQSSFAFTVKESNWREVDRETLTEAIDAAILDKVSYGGKVSIRELVKGGKLYDVSPVTFPAYQNATSEARNSELMAERDRALGKVQNFENGGILNNSPEVIAPLSVLKRILGVDDEQETESTTEQEHRAAKDETEKLNIRLRVAMAAGNTITLHK